MIHLIKCLNRLAPLATVSWLIVVCVVIYWKYFDNPLPVRVNSVQILDLAGNPNMPHHSSDVVILHVDVCQNVPGVPGTGVRKIIGPGPSGYTHLLTESYVDPLVECTQHDRHIPLPKLDPGDYIYVFQAQYQINPIKTVVYTQPSVPVVIIQ